MFSPLRANLLHQTACETQTLRLRPVPKPTSGDSANLNSMA